MVKWIEATGRSEEDAIQNALAQLGLDRDSVSVEVLERARNGFLGFGSSPAKVKVKMCIRDRRYIVSKRPDSTRLSRVAEESWER